MNFTRVAFCFLAVNLSACVASGRDLAGIPTQKLEKLLRKTEPGAIWQIDQLATGHDGNSWAISFLEAPRWISGSYCAASLVNLGVELRDGDYLITERDDARPVVAWKRCDAARLEKNDFHDVFGSATPGNLAEIMTAIEEFMRTGGNSGSLVSHFESDNLRSCVTAKNLKYLDLLDIKKDGSILISFWIPQLFPDEMDVRLIYKKGRISEAYVSRGPGPDFQ